MLQMMTMERKIPDADRPAFLRSTSDELRDPQTAKPAIWDLQHRIIYFPRDGTVQISSLWVAVDKQGGVKYYCPNLGKSKCH